MAASVAVQAGVRPKVELVASPAMCQHAFDCIRAELANAPQPLPPYPVDGASAPLFVTFDRMAHGRASLRGCIGTLSPTSLSQVGYYAKRSAFKDRRFTPIEAGELPSLRVGVSLLVSYEKAQDAFDWNIDRHGLIIEFTDSTGRAYSATYLPHVAKEQGWDHEQALQNLVKKSGYTGKLSMQQLRNIGTTRYQSSKARMTYAEYIKLTKQTG